MRRQTRERGLTEPPGPGGVQRNLCAGSPQEKAHRLGPMLLVATGCGKRALLGKTNAKDFRAIYASRSPVERGGTPTNSVRLGMIVVARAAPRCCNGY